MIHTQSSWADVKILGFLPIVCEEEQLEYKDKFSDNLFLFLEERLKQIIMHKDMLSLFCPRYMCELYFHSDD